MKNADYYIKKVFRLKTTAEARQLQSEVKEWIKSADKKEIEAYRDSGAGEMLYMMCL